MSHLRLKYARTFERKIADELFNSRTQKPLANLKPTRYFITFETEVLHKKRNTISLPSFNRISIRLLLSR